MLGAKVVIVSDNENYTDWLDKTLTIVYVGSYDHPGFDPSGGSRIYEFEDEDGNDVPFALYSYEFKKTKANE